MGLSSYPTPSDGGVLCLIMVGTVVSISIVKGILLSILHVAGIRIASWEEYSVESNSDYYERHGNPSETYMDEFRSRTPAVRYESICEGRRQPEQECSVCLSDFEPHAEINHLLCGHLFHKMCLEKWLNYWNLTCPLCRTPMVQGEEEDTAPW